MNPVLDEILKDTAMVGRNGERIALESQISAEEGMHIQQVIASLKPRTTLEIGMAYGVSTLFICEAVAAIGGEKHIVIDPYQNNIPDESLAPDKQPADPGWRGLGLFNVEKAGYAEMVEFHDKPSYAALPEILASGRKIDYALIDGMHTFDFVLVDFFYIDLLLNIGGVITFDDLSYPSIRKLCRYILTNRAYRIFSPDAVSDIGKVFSFKRKLFEGVLKIPAFGSSLLRWCKSELLLPDFQLGLPYGNYVSFQKCTEDTIMSVESKNYRRWDTHRDF